MIKSIFPEEMMKSSAELSLEGIASRFDYLFQQLHLLHLQTPSYAEHQALNLYDSMPGAKDEFMEKLMGYEGRKLRSYKTAPIMDYSPGSPMRVVNELKSFAEELESYASSKNYSDIENLAQSLSGSAAKTLFLLTLS